MKFSKDYEGIVISSGSGGGYGMLGFLHTLYSKRNMSRIKYFAGTSVGALICMFLALGASPLDIFSKMCSKDVNEYLGISTDINLWTEQFGLIDSQKLKLYFTELVTDIYGFVPTFQQLKEKTNNTLIIASFNVSKNKGQYFSPTTSPEIDIVTAVVCSFCIPIMFTKMSYKGDYYVDGALFDRCPVEECKREIEINGYPPYKIFVLFCAKPLELKEDCSLAEYIKAVCFSPINKQPVPLSSDEVDVFEIENDFEDMTLKVDTETRIKNFTRASDFGKQYL